MPSTTKQRARRTRARVERSPWAARIGRLGLVSRGVMYCVVSGLAVAVAFGDREHEVDREGALRSVVNQPFGRWLLGALIVGFASYALWRFTKAALGSGEGSGRASGAAGWAKRAADVGRGLIYVGLVWASVRLLMSREAESSRRSGNAEAQEWSARVLSHAGGRWLVIAVGVALMVTGAVLTKRAIAQKFDKHLDLRRMSAAARTWLPRLGTAGYTARGVVAALVGVFLVQAGWTFDPQDAVGIDGALKRLAQRSYGPAMLTIVGLGLLSFGLFSFVEARWRKVLDA